MRTGKIFIFILLFSLVSQTQVFGQDSFSPDTALQRLKEGNTRYVNGKPLRALQGADRRKITAAKGQKPFATILGCSDSRVPLEVIFDAEIGELFVIRVAGNVADVDEIGSIEYGVDHLGTPVLLVLGHTQCGAVTAVAEGAQVHGSIPSLVDNIIPAVEKTKQKYPNLKGAELISRAIESNVWQGIDDVFKNSEIVRERVKAGKLSVIGGIYNIETGTVEWLGPHPDQKRLLTYTSKENTHGN